MFDKLKKLIKGEKKCDCGDECVCHSDPEPTGACNGSINMDNLSPEEQALLMKIMTKVEPALDDLEDGDGLVEEGPDLGDPADPKRPCIHMRVVVTCHAQDGDMKPANCSITTCPARMLQEQERQEREKENRRYYS